MLAIYQPYPYYYRSRGLPKIVGVYFIIIFLFLWLFKPFHVNTDEQKVSYVAICLIHAASPSIIFYVYFLLFNLLATELKIEKWIVRNEIIHLSILFFLIGIASFLVRDVIYTNPDNWSGRYFVEEVINTFLAGSLISVLLILLNFYRLNSSTKKQAELVNTHLPVNTVSELELISIKTNVKADDFTLRLHDFLFARAEGNYLEIYCQRVGETKKELKRMTLSQLESQLSSVAYIIRSHRAYIVNTRCVLHVAGNAQGYLLSFSTTSEQVPVSRSRISAFDKLLK